MSMSARRLFSLVAAVLSSAALESTISGSQTGPPVGRFEVLSTITVGSVAEIVDASPDGLTLAYTNSGDEEVGLIDIADPSDPVLRKTQGVGGQPTAIAYTADGLHLLVTVRDDPQAPTHRLKVLDATTLALVRDIALGGQPDAVDVSPDGRYAAVAVENEREGGEADMPHDPPGFVTVVTLSGPPAGWQTHDVVLTGLLMKFPTDPEPEFIDINAANIAAVTLQENNHVVLINLATRAIVGHFTAGITSHAADLDDDDQILFDDVLTARREPDAIAWTSSGNLLVANEGDYTNDLEDGEFVGGRNFTLFTTEGAVVFDAGAELEQAAAAAGFYDDARSDARGCEIEGAAIGEFNNHTFAFVGAERCEFVAVYRLKDRKPVLEQILPSGERPEGLKAIPSRGLFVSANEDDGTIWIYGGAPGHSSSN